MKRNLVNILVVIMALIFQVIYPPDFIFEGVRPDFLLVVSVVIGLIWGVRYGAGLGFVAGLLQDLFLGSMFGIYTVVKLFAGGVAGFMDGIVFKEKIFIPPVIIFIMTIIHETLIILLSESLIFNVNYLAVLKSIILPGALLNAIIGFIVYSIYYRILDPGGNYYG